jgi:hypothetical protein
MAAMVLILVGTYIKDPTGGFALVGGVLAVATILAATTADLDINVFLAHNQRFFALILFVYLCMTVVLALVLKNPMASVMLLPLLYALVRFKRIVCLTPGFLWPTELITICLSFASFGFGCNYLKRVDIDWATFHAQCSVHHRLAIDGPEKCSVGPSIAIASTYFSGVPFCLLRYWWSWRKGLTPTVRLYTVLYAWLIIEGVASIIEDTCSRTLGYHFDEFADSRRPMDVLNGPSYLLLPALMTCFRSRLHGRLGRRWARQRMRDGAEIACLLERASMDCGVEYWLHRPDLCDKPGCLDLKCTHLKCSTHHHRACTCQVGAGREWPRWVRGEIVAVDEGTSFTVQVHCSKLYYTIQYYTVPYYTILYYTILYCTVLYHTNYTIRWWL